LEECRTMKMVEWTQERVEAFEWVKAIFAEDILLRHVQWDKEMILTTDASQSGLGAWIGQYDDAGILHPVVCASKKLTAAHTYFGRTTNDATILTRESNVRGASYSPISAS
jgi:hypothetical protein